MDYLTWNTIPQHILVTVFSYLPVNDRLNASLTCKYWSECFHSPMLWSKFVFKFDANVDGEGKAIRCMEKYCDVLKDVTIYVNQAQKLSRDRALQVVDKLAALSKKKIQKFAFCFTVENPLCFNGNEILNKLKNLFSPSPESELVFHLRVIDLNLCNIPLDNKLITILADQHSLLRVVKVQNSCLIDNVTPSSMVHLIEKCVCLEELHTFYHCINSDVVKKIAEKGRVPFKVLSLMCNRSDKYNELIPSDAWLQFSLANAKAEVTIKFHSSMLHHKIIPLLCPGIPLVALDMKVYGWLADELQHVAVTFSDTLKYLSFNPSLDMTLKAPPGVEPALLEIASRCEQLKELHCYCALTNDVIDSIKKMRAFKKYTLYNMQQSVQNALNAI